MKIKKEYLILILIIIGLSVYLFMRSTDRAEYQLPNLTPLEPGKISKIEITKDGDTITLKKKDNHWHLEPMGYLADTGKINPILAVFENLSLATLVSESKDYQRYDLDQAKRISAKAWQEDTLKRSFDIGKTASSFRHTFVKLDDDSRVFHATDNFRDRFAQTVDSLRNHEVLAFKAGDIQTIHISKDQTSIEMIRKEVPVEPAASQTEKPATAPAAVKFEWIERSGKPVKGQELNRLLTTLGSLNCARYIEDRAKETFSEPIYTVKLKGIEEHQLDIFARIEDDADHYPAISSGSKYAFLLSNNQMELIMKDPVEMLQKPAEGSQ